MRQTPPQPLQSLWQKPSKRRARTTPGSRWQMLGGVANAAYFPWLDATASVTNGMSGSYGALGMKGLAASPLKNLFGASVNLWWRWDFGTIPKVSAAESDLKAGEARIALVRWHLTYEVSSLFHECLRSSDVLASTEALVEEQQIRLDMVASMAESGLSSETDLGLAGADMAESISQLLKAQLQVESCRLRLAELMGRNGEDPLPEPEHLAPEIPPTETLESLLTKAHQHRPDRRALIAMKNAAESRAEAAWSQHLPTLTATASGGYALVEDSVNDVFNDTPFYAVGVGLKIPLFEGLRANGEEAQHQAKALGLNERIHALDLAIAREVRTALVQLEAAAMRLEHFDITIPALEIALAQAHMEFRAGLTDALRVAMATRALFVAKQDVAGARAAQGQAIAAMAHALGTDL